MQAAVITDAHVHARHHRDGVLVGPVIGGVGAVRIVLEQVFAGGQVDGAAAGQVQVLALAGGGQIEGQVVAAGAQVGEGVALLQVVVLPVAVAVQGLHRGGGAGVVVGAAFTLMVAGGPQAAAGGAEAAAGDFHAGLVPVALAGDDVDRAADHAVAVQRRAGAGQHFDALDRRQRDRGDVRAGQVHVAVAATVEQHQGVGGGVGAEALHINGGAGAVDAEIAAHLDAAQGVQHVRQIIGGHCLDGVAVQDQGAGGQFPRHAGGARTGDLHRGECVVGLGHRHVQASRGQSQLYSGGHLKGVGMHSIVLPMHPPYMGCAPAVVGGGAPVATGRSPGSRGDAVTAFPGRAWWRCGNGYLIPLRGQRRPFTGFPYT